MCQKLAGVETFYRERLLVQKFSGVSLFVHLLLEEVLWCNSFLV